MAKEAIKLKFNLSRALWWGGEDIWSCQAVPLHDLLKPLFKNYGNYAVVRLLARHIMSISGHANEQGLASYNSRPSTSQLWNC